MKLSPILVGVISLFTQLTEAAPAPQAQPAANTRWDAIIVGAGPAGIIMGDRLSAAGKKVLLLEAGGPSYYRTGGRDRPSWLDNTQLSRVDVPGLYTSIFSDQGTLTCTGKVNAFGGCTVGGSSAINAGLYFQPPSSDFDTYFPAGWKYSDVLPSIKRLLARQHSITTTSADKQYYLQSGYQAVRDWIVGGAGFTELSINQYANRKKAVFGRPVFDYTSNGQRGGPVTTYLQTALARPKLFSLLTGTQVKRIVRNGGTATGVLATRNGAQVTYPLAAGGRVILSGGALQSPGLLYYSGIGPASTLSSLASQGRLTSAPSTWINNSAVGAGLFDNPNTFISLSSPSITSYSYSYSDPPAGDESLYLQSARSGPYTFAGQTSVFWDYVTLPSTGTRQFGMQGTISPSGAFDYSSDPNSITLNVYGTSGLLSRGQVVLDANNGLPGPSADTYYSNPADADAISTWIYQLFQSLPADLTPQNIPRNASQADIRQYITTYSQYARGEVNHWSSSCKLGACVDAKTLVVKGTKNVHVCDASVLAPVTTNPQFATMVAAERGAELILAL